MWLSQAKIIYITGAHLGWKEVMATCSIVGFPHLAWKASTNLRLQQTVIQQLRFQTSETD